MSTHEERRMYAAEAEAERRLRAAQLDLVRPVVTVQGVAALLQQIDPVLVNNLPESVSADEFEHLVLWLNQAGQDLQAVLDKLALPAHKN